MHQSANPWVQTLSAYQPGKSAAVDGLARRPVKLSSNENPRGGAARIAHLLASQSDCDIGRYPDDASALLRAALAGQLGLALDNVLVGSGSSDILSMVAKTFLAPGRVALISSCTFSLYRVIAQAVGADINVVPSDDYGHDLDALARAAASSHLVLIDNPCNPSGRYLPYASLARFLAGLRSDLPVVIDEAYFEYATQSDYASCIDLIERHPNLLVVRTFSKAHGLAGARLGYCIGHPQLIGLVNRMRAPFNVSALASQLGIAALAEPHFLSQSCASNAAERARLAAALAAMGIIAVESAANFLFLPVRRDAAQLAQLLEGHGVLVRALADHPQHLRVTIGLPDENARFLEAMAGVLAA